MHAYSYTVGIRPNDSRLDRSENVKTTVRRSVTSVGVCVRASGRSLPLTTAENKTTIDCTAEGGKDIIIIIIKKPTRTRRRLRRSKLRMVGARRSGTTTAAPPHPPRLIL